MDNSDPARDALHEGWLAAVLKREPAMAAGITTAIVTLAAVFGLDWAATVVGPVVAVVTLMLSAVVRSRVTPAKPAAPEHAGR
jgi:hypothetical protein